MIMYINEFQKSQFADIREFDISRPGCKINFYVYFQPVGRV